MQDTLNLYNVLCQLYLSKIGKKFSETYAKGPWPFFIDHIFSFSLYDIVFLFPSMIVTFN